MLSKGYYKVLALIHVLAVTLFLSGCMGFNNKQLTSQLEGIDVSVYEDERGLIIALPTVYFDFDSSNLKVSSREKIAQIATILNHERSKDRIISVEGHSDNIGDPNYNLTLSAERADVVMKELVSVVSIRGDCRLWAKAKIRPLPTTVPEKVVRQIAGLKLLYIIPTSL